MRKDKEQNVTKEDSFIKKIISVCILSTSIVALMWVLFGPTPIDNTTAY